MQITVKEHVLVCLVTYAANIKLIELSVEREDATVSLCATFLSL